MATDPFLRFLASWALVHETADEGWKAAVERGAEQEPGQIEAGPDAFVDGLSALVAEEKERLKAQIARGELEGSADTDLGGHIDELRFEIGELRGRLESMQATLDAIARKSDDQA